MKNFKLKPVLWMALLTAAIQFSVDPTFAAGAFSPAFSTVVASPTSVPADNVTTSTITVHTKDGSNANMTGCTVDLNPPCAVCTTSVSPYSQAVDANGFAVFTVKDSAPESVTYTATVTGCVASTPITQTATVNFTGANPTASLVVSGYSTSQTAGSPFSITVTAKDAGNATVTSYTGTVHFTSTDAYPAVLPSDYTFVAGDNGVHTFTNLVTLKTAGSKTVTATDTVTGSITGVTSSITVGAGTPDHLSWNQQPTNAASGSSISPAVSLKILDAYNNQTASTASVTLSILNNAGGTGVLTGGGATSAVAGSVSFSSLSIDQMGNGYTLQATAAALPSTTAGASSSFNITAGGAPIPIGGGGAATLSISGYSTSQTAGAPFSITVTAKDAGNATVTSYTGTVHFTSTDAYPAVLPSDYTFVAGDNGVHTFTNLVTLKTAGSKTVTATDTVTGSITGVTSSITVNPAAVSKLIFSAQASATAAQSAAFAAQPATSATDLYGNVVSSYAGTVALAAYTDASCTSAAAGGTVGGATAALSSGVATFTSARYSKTGTFYFGATSGGLTPGCSNSFVITAAPLAKFTSCRKLVAQGYTEVIASERPSAGSACSANENLFYSLVHGVPSPKCVATDCGLQAKVCRDISTAAQATHYYCAFCPSGSCP